MIFWVMSKHIFPELGVYVLIGVSYNQGNVYLCSFFSEGISTFDTQYGIWEVGVSVKMQR